MQLESSRDTKRTHDSSYQFPFDSHRKIDFPWHSSVRARQELFIVDRLIAALLSCAFSSPMRNNAAVNVIYKMSNRLSNRRRFRRDEYLKFTLVSCRRICSGET